MDLTSLPAELPAPVDDGACNHLNGMRLPSVILPSHKKGSVDISSVAGWLILYFYPMIGQPDTALPDDWNQIPGARGCTPQSCSFRDHFKELQTLGATVFGVSSQCSEYQAEAAARLHLPFELLSDIHFDLAGKLNLPTFETGGQCFIRRITLIAKAGVVQKVFYPVFPPNKNADDVIHWISSNRQTAIQ